MHKGRETMDIDDLELSDEILSSQEMLAEQHQSLDVCLPANDKSSLCAQPN
jgi:hypothetical protein